MALHPSKQAALLPLCNFLTSGQVSSVKDLSDGKVLQKIISFVFPEFSKEFNEFENQIKDDNNKTESCEKEELVPVSTVESEDVDTESKKDENAQESFFKLFEPLHSGNKEILKRFAIIQKFIDEQYNLKSEEIISYCKCFESDELEIAKVAFFVLAEVVQFFVQVNNENLQSLSHLDIQTQEDIRECLDLFISHKESLSKYKVEKVLTTQAKYKVPSPTQRGFFVTPQRKCSSTYRRNPETPTEEIFTNSPLKSFFESPVFKKEDIKKKDKEIKELRKHLYDEEAKYEDVRCNLKDAEVQLQLKNNEISLLKEKNKELMREIENLNTLQTRNEEALLEAEKRNKKNPTAHDNFLLNEVAELHMKQSVLKTEIECYKEKLNNLDIFYKKKLYDLNTRHEKVVKDLADDLGIKGFAILEKEDEIEALKKVFNDVHQKLSNSEKNSSIYVEESSEAKAALNKNPELSSGENIGAIIQEENKMLQARLRKAEIQIQELTQKLHLKDQFNGQKQVHHSENSTVLSMPKLLDMSDISQTEKFRNSATHSESSKEFRDLYDEHYTLNNSDTALKLPVTSSQYEINQSSEAVLWRQYDSQCVIEETNEIDPIDLDRNLNSSGKMSELGCIDAIPETSKNLDSIGVPKHVEKQDCMEIVPDSNENLSFTGIPEESENFNYTSIPEKMEKLESRNIVPEKKINHVDILQENTDEVDQTDVTEHSEVFENLNFTKFLDALKRISTNGSFKNVKKMLEKQKSELSVLLKASTPNSSNGCNAEVLLNVITDCISVATASHFNCQDKGCVKSEISENVITESNPKYQINEVTEKPLNQLKNMEDQIKYMEDQIKNMEDQIKNREDQIKKYSCKLKEEKENFEKMKTAKKFLSIQYEESLLKNREMNRIIKDLQENLNDTKESWKTLSKENEQKASILKGVLKRNKYLEARFTSDYKKLSEYKQKCDLLVKRDKQSAERYSTKLNILMNKLDHEKTYRKALLIARKKLVEDIKNLLKNERDLQQKVSELTADLKNIKRSNYAVAEKEDKSSEREMTFPEENRVIQKHSFDKNSESVLNEFSLSQDIYNESIVSGALYNKTQYNFLVSHDEDDFLNQSSLADIKMANLKKNKDELLHQNTLADIKEEVQKGNGKERAKELLRRNSIQPLHLQSAYAIESDLPLHNESFYVKFSGREKYRETSEKQQNDDQPTSKKRKIMDTEAETPLETSVTTPTTRMRTRFMTPSSLTRLLFSRNRRPGCIKPKP